MGDIKNTKLRIDLLSLIDCSFSISVEKKKHNGEDSEKHSINRESALVGVFDGCGGAGAKLCTGKNLNKTEAYVASRATADAFEDWFDAESDRTVDGLKSAVLDKLGKWEASVGGKTQLMGGISKRFPTTAAVAVCSIEEKGIGVDVFWAGDSRVYLLNSDGLAQLTEDDLGGIDAMQNLTDDGVMTNLITLSRDFTIHSGHICLRKPGIIFASTDGCFGYLSTPMEFEYLLLKTLLCADNIKDWEKRLAEEIGKTAADDYTMSGVIIGYGSFSKLRRVMSARTKVITDRYIKGISGKTYSEKLEMWNDYKQNYYRLLIKAADN